MNNADGRVKCYHALKKTWGIAKFLDIETFSNPQNGYLLDDTCFWELLSMMKKPSTYFKTWKITKFSSLSSKPCFSKDFGDYRYYWYISLFPKGVGKSKGNSISIYLYINAIKSKIPIDRKLFTKFILRIKDQTNGNHIEIEDNYLYSSDNYVSGGVEFLSLAKLKDPKMGFLVDDTVIIEAKVTLLGLVMKES
ncbi:hypothetical protein ACOSQ3_000369 [Xanthoceras sorbifolium]